MIDRQYFQHQQMAVMNVLFGLIQMMNCLLKKIHLIAQILKLEQIENLEMLVLG